MIGLLNFLRDHDHLLEMFLENRDPYATQPLPQWVVEAVRPHLGRQDRIRALASGRIVGANRGVWVVTDRELLVVESGIKPRVRSLPLNSVELCSNLKGKYGQTLRVEGTRSSTKSVFSGCPGATGLERLARTTSVLHDSRIGSGYFGSMTREMALPLPPPSSLNGLCNRGLCTPGLSMGAYFFGRGVFAAQGLAGSSWWQR